MISEISQIKEDKYYIVSLIYGIRMEKKRMVVDKGLVVGEIECYKSKGTNF